MTLRAKNGANQLTIRRSRILEAIDKSGFAKVCDLSADLNASEVTIRKDLEFLESQGLLTRVHGGAKKKQHSFFDYYAQDKQEAKQQIAAAAAALVKDGDFIFINVGTTCMYVCEALKAKQNITVVTNSTAILNTLFNSPNITVIFLGGIVNNDMQITTGDDVVDQLAKYTADKLFLGMDGVDAEMGATTYNHIEDAIIKQMIQHAKEKILVVDDSKIGKVTFARVAHLSDFDAIITNYNESKQSEMEKIEALGVHIIYA